jgi:nicotinic acid mononucleotide adenylyltransferase
LQQIQDAIHSGELLRAADLVHRSAARRVIFLQTNFLKRQPRWKTASERNRLALPDLLRAFVQAFEVVMASAPRNQRRKDRADYLANGRFKMP